MGGADHSVTKIARRREVDVILVANMTIEFHLIWKDQCDAARGIKEEFGAEKALGYLIGEKLVNFVRAAQTRPEFAAELPNFAAEISGIFEPHEVGEYLDSVKRIGAMGHICSDEEYEFFREHGAIEESPVTGAEDILIMERIREMLTSEAR